MIDDLRLREHGFAVYQLEPARFQPYPDGNVLVFWDDVERTAEGMRRLSAHDAAAYPRWLDFWRRAAGLIHPYFLTAPPSLSELVARARRTGDEDVLETLLTPSMADLVQAYFESPWLQGATIQAHDVGDPAAVGSAFCQSYIRCDMYSRPEDCGIVRGGMGTITQAMLRSAEQSGATVRTGVSVRRVLVEDGAARGVELADGEVIASRAVLSNADPKRTYLGLVGAEHLDSSVPAAGRAAQDPCHLSEVPRRLARAPGLLPLPRCRLSIRARSPTSRFVPRRTTSRKAGTTRGTAGRRGRR